jgi:RND family efflux transporter MFP subunit
VVVVSTPVEARLKAVTVDRGDLVTEGQVIASLESDVEKAAVAVARARAESDTAIQTSQARLEFAIRKLARSQEVGEAISTREMDEVETSKRLAELSLLEAKENKRLAGLELTRAVELLAERTIRSPISGVVVERMMAPGEFAKQAQILKLAQIDPLRVEVVAPIDLLGKITVGTRAEVIPEEPVGGVYEARVKVIDRVVDAASGTFGVRIELPNPRNRLPGGIKCKVRFL